MKNSEKTRISKKNWLIEEKDIVKKLGSNFFKELCNSDKTYATRLSAQVPPNIYVLCKILVLVLLLIRISISIKLQLE